jgi:hypothetical protein
MNFRANCRPILAALTLAFVVTASSASAVTLDIDTLPTGNIVSVAAGDYVLDLRERTASSMPWGDFDAVANVGGGNQAIVDADISNSSGAGFFIRRADNQPFNLVSLDLAELANNSSGFGAVQVSVNPYNSTQDFVPASSTFSTVSPTGFTDVPHIFINIGSFGGKNFAVDNIVVTTVPEPAAALLALTALGMILIRRR